MQQSSASETKCVLCGKEGPVQRCSRCKSTLYCDRNCQQIDWPAHKQNCQAPSKEVPAVTWAPTKKGQQKELTVKEVVVQEKRAPTNRIFPEGLRDFVFHKSADGVEENLLVMFHGLGDTCKSFAALGQRMKLPQTSTLSISGPIHIPETDGGRAWFASFDEDWNLIEPRPGERRRLESLRQTRKKLVELLENLEKKCGWRREKIHLLGFSQGGTVALDFALNSCGVKRLGGVVALSACILPEAIMQASPEDVGPCEKACTPVLAVRGTQDDVVSRKDWQESLSYYKARHPCADVEAKEVRKGHQMVSSGGEMRILMQFWAKTLTRKSALERMEGLVEVTGNHPKDIMGTLDHRKEEQGSRDNG